MPSLITAAAPCLKCEDGECSQAWLLANRLDLPSLFRSDTSGPCTGDMLLSMLASLQSLCPCRVTLLSVLEPTGVLRSQHAAQSTAGNVQLAGFAPAPPSQLSHSSSRHICMASLISPSFHSLVRARASSCLLGLVASYPYPPQSHLCLDQSALGFLGAGMWCSRYGDCSCCGQRSQEVHYCMAQLSSGTCRTTI